VVQSIRDSNCSDRISCVNMLVSVLWLLWPALAGTIEAERSLCTVQKKAHGDILYRASVFVG
jgi:hypothetical protein